MGREIRMVPPHWEHPRWKPGEVCSGRTVGSYRPCYDEDYETAAKEWIANFDLWRNGEHDKQDATIKYYWEYENTPDEETCRPAFEQESTWLQVYETVSEGTPVTPPFATKQEPIDYLSTMGDFWDQKRREGPWNRESAEKFVNAGYFPSMMAEGTEAGVKFTEAKNM